MFSPKEPEESSGDGPGEHLAIAVSLFSMGLHRALARQHGWNESLNPRESLLGVALGDQAGISADAPTDGAKETA